MSKGPSLEAPKMKEEARDKLYASSDHAAVQKQYERVRSPPSARTQPQHVQQPNDPFNDARSDDSHGVALKAAKDKWNELGPLRLEDIMRNSKEPIDQSRTFG